MIDGAHAQKPSAAEVAAEWLSGIAELKLAADAGLTGAEAIGCAIP